jgi:hypothetical protein
MWNALIRLRTIPASPYLLLALLAFALAQLASAQSDAAKASVASPHAIPNLFNRVIENQKKNEAALDEYQRIERVEIRKAAGDPQPTTTKISRVVPSGTGMEHFPLGVDEKPVDAAAYRAHLEQLEKVLSLVVQNAQSQRSAVDKYVKKRHDRDELIAATRKAFLFTFIAEETRGERLLAKYAMAPNPSFKPTSRFTSIYPKVRGFVWVDEQSAQLARIEGDVTEDISVGLFLAKIYKGSHFMQERYEFVPGLWLPSFSQYDFDGRKFFSSFSIHERTFYSNFKHLGPPAEELSAIRAELALAESGK